MWCKKYRRLLVPYIECDLNERARAKVEAHLSGCPDCAREAELIRSVSGVIRTAQTPPVEPAPDLWAKVSARIEREAPRRAPRPWLRVTQAASACAAAVLVAAVGFGLMRADLPSENPRSAPAQPMVYNKAKPEARVAKQVETATPAPRAAYPTHKLASRPASVSICTGERRSAPVPRQSVVLVRSRVAVVPGLAPAPPVEPAEKPAAASSAPPPVRMDALALSKGVPSDSLALSVAPPSPRVAYGGSAEPESKCDESIAPGAAATTAGHLSRGVITDAGRGTRVYSLLTRVSPAKPGAIGRLINNAPAGKDESVVDALNETEGVRRVALFQYP